MNNFHNKSLSDEVLSRLAALKHIALDMDGTIYMGKTLFPFTNKVLEGFGKMGVEHSFLTNNPTSSVQAYIDKLHKMGIACTEDNMYTTSIATIDYIKAHWPSARRLFILGTPSCIEQFEKAGFEMCEDNAEDRPDVVIASFDKTLIYSRFCRTAWWVSQGVPFLATNPDWVCPTDEPTVLIDCGSITAAITAATGRKPDCVLGKPDPSMLEGIMQRHGLRANQMAMIGDRLYTDVATAINAGSVGVLVLSGESTMQTVAESSVKPTLICQDLDEFFHWLTIAKQ